jgi:uncharacterized protein (TIGR03067 family)
MIQFALAFNERACSGHSPSLLGQSNRFCFWGIIMMAVTNRMRVRASLAAGLTVGLALAIWAGLSAGGSMARTLGDDKPQSELLKPLQGTWNTEGDGLDAKWTFEGDKLKATVNGTDYTCKAKVDPDAKPFATIDLVIDDGPEEAKGKTSKGIYKIDGEKLTVCTSAPGKDRPKEFTQVEDEAYLFAMKKQK